MLILRSLIIQGKPTFPRVMSTKPRSSIVSLKRSHSSSKQRLPPFFSSKEVIRLKSPPTTQCALAKLSHTPMREPRKSHLSPSLCVPQTFVNIPVIGKPTTLKFAVSEFRVPWNPLKSRDGSQRIPRPPENLLNLSPYFHILHRIPPLALGSDLLHTLFLVRRQYPGLSS